MRVKRGTLRSERRGGRMFVSLGPSQPDDRPDEPTALISTKDELIATLSEQLEAERQAHAEARRIIAGLVERIPAIEPPSRERPRSYREPRSDTTTEATESQHAGTWPPGGVGFSGS
jgi:hypothetical protein